MRSGARPLTVTLRDVCFLHWPVATATVAASVPDWLTVDEADGTAWVSALPLTMARFDAFGVPVRRDVGGLNLRTYVRGPDGDRGVYFLSLDATDRVAVTVARRLFRLPYYYADVRRTERDGRTNVSVRRTAERDAALELSYRPAGGERTASADTLASFLTERYRYFTTGPLGTRLVGSVGHEPWELGTAEATVQARSLLPDCVVDSSESEPLVHYSPGTEMRVGVPRPVDGVPRE